MKEEGSLKTLDEQIRVRMARTGESYEDAATAIGHYNDHAIYFVWNGYVSPSRSAFGRGPTATRSRGPQRSGR